MNDMNKRLERIELSLRLQDVKLDYAIKMLEKIRADIDALRTKAKLVGISPPASKPDGAVPLYAESQWKAPPEPTDVLPSPVYRTPYKGRSF